MNHHEPSQAYSKIIARCWADEDFQDRFLAHPATVLSALLSASFAVVYVAQMAAYSLPLAAAALALLLASFLYLFSLVRRSRTVSLSCLQGLRDANSWLVQMLEGAMKIRMTGAEDRIVVLKEGSIEESGSYDELVAKGGLFASLIRRQRS